jgi:type IV pilus assembly protein PilW
MRDDDMLKKIVIERKKIYFHQRGLSLVELMIAITLGLILTAGVLQLFASNNQTFRTQQATSRVQEAGRLAVEFIASDIRMAGASGFRGRLSAVKNQLAAPVDYRMEYENGISFIAAADATGVTAKAGTNVLILRGAVQENSSPLIKPAEAGTLTVALVEEKASACPGGVNTSYNGLCVNENAFIADYQKTFTFKITGLAKVDSGANLEISYSPDWGGNYLDPDEYFVQGAIVSPARSTMYFIDTGASGQPSLFQQINTEAPMELLEGVANIGLVFNRDNSKAVYNTALGALDGLWNNQANPIVSVRVELLMQSVTDNILDEAQVYSFNGDDDITATDRRLYKVFNSTVALRNQLP